jgi:hypothetical protein
MNEDVIQRRREGARSRNSTYLVFYEKWDKDVLLEFMDEYRTEGELIAAGRYWWFNWDFTMTKQEDLWPGEDKLTRTRRLRNNKKWEVWR